MANQVLTKPNIADFYAPSNKPSSESLECANSLLKQQLESYDDSLANGIFLAGIKAFSSPESNFTGINDLESILAAAAAAGFEVEVTSV